MSNKITQEETRAIAERFLELFGNLERTLMGLRTPMGVVWEDGGMEDGEGPKHLPGKSWLMRFTDPLGGDFALGHEEILLGLERCVYASTPSHEDEFIRDWVMTPAVQRKVEKLGDWAVSRICQRGLFGNHLPYGEASINAFMLLAEQMAEEEAEKDGKGEGQ